MRQQRFALAPLALAACLAAAVAPALAQRAAVPDAPLHLSIAAQPLGQALNELARQANLQLMFPPGLVAGKTAPAVQGELTPRQALARLLSGSGLVSTIDGATVVIRGAAPGEAAEQQLPAVTVTGSASPERGAGPVDGLVARHTTTGTKTDTALLETPQSVSVVPREMISDLGAQTVSQALRYSAGLVPDNSGFETRFDWLTIRGFSASTLGLYLDGLRLQSNTEFQVEPYGLERIEVLRGPSSVLYGQNTPGGLVNMVTKKPPEIPLHEIQVGFGSFNNKQAAFDLGGPVDDDGKVLYRLTGLLRDSDSQVDYTPNDRVYIAPSLTWKTTDSTTLTLQASYQRDNVGFGQFLPAYGTALPNPNGQIAASRFLGEPGYDKITREQTMAGYSLEHRFDDALVFRQNFRYAHLDYDVRTDGYGFGFATVNAANPADPANFRYVSRLPFSDTRRADVFGVDNQLQAKVRTGPFEHTLLAGLDYYDYSEDRAMRMGLARNTLDLFAPSYGTATLGAMRQSSDTNSHYRQLGLYAQDQLKLDQHWQLTLGMRQDWARQDVQNRLAGSSSGQSDSAQSYRAALMYLSDLGLAPYLSYSESFQPNIGTDRDGSQFSPSRGRQYEVGVKYQPRGANSFVTLSLYDIRMTDVLVSDPVNAAYSAAIGEQHAQGVDVEGVAELRGGLKLIGSLTYTNVVNAKTTDTTTLGKTPTQQPRVAASLWADYTLRTGMLRNLGFGAGVRYVGPTYIDAANALPKAASRTLFDLGLHYRYDAHWRFQVDASNLFDRIYAICVTPNQCAYGARRTVLGTVKYSW